MNGILRKSDFFIPGVLITLLMFPLVSLAEDNNGTEEDHNALRELKALYEKSVNTNNMELLRPVMADKFSVITFTGREFTDFGTFKTQWAKTREKMLGETGSFSVELIPQRSRIFGDTAITFGSSNNTMVTGDGDKFEFPVSWTAACRKIDGEWKIVRAHGSISPFDNPMLKSKVRSYILYTAVAGALAGLIAGWFIRGFISTRRLRKSKA